MPTERAPQSVEEWEASLPPCVECGRRIDALDHIEGRDTCVGCELDAACDDWCGGLDREGEGGDA